MVTRSAPAHSLREAGVWIPFGLCGLIWGSTWVVLHNQLQGFPVDWSVALRFALAAPLMFVVAWVSTRRLAMPGRAHGLAMLVGALLFTLNYNFVYQANVSLTSGIVGVMTSLMVVPNAVFGWLLLRQRVSAQFIAGSALALSGAGLLLAHEAAGAGVVRDVWLGAAFVVGAQVSSSLAGVVQANRTGRSQPVVTFLAWAMLYGLVANLGWALWQSGMPVLPVRAGFWLGLGYLAVIGTVVPFPLYFRLVRQIGPGPAGYSNMIVLTVAMAMSTAFEGYRWSAMAAAGIMLCMTGLAIALGTRGKPVTS